MQAPQLQGNSQITASIFVARNKPDKEICFVARLIIAARLPSLLTGEKKPG
jgi:hypothetical protein